MNANGRTSGPRAPRHGRGLTFEAPDYIVIHPSGDSIRWRDGSKSLGLGRGRAVPT